MSRLVQTWRVQGNKMVKLATPPRTPRTQTVNKSGTITIAPKVFTGGTPVLELPFPTYTDKPLVQWETLDTQYSLRNLNLWAEQPNISDVVRRLTSPAYVELPEGFRGKYVDFNSGGTPYAAYLPNNVGFWGHGADRAIMRMEPYTSTKMSQIPQQGAGSTTVGGVDGVSLPFTLMRQGPQNGTFSGAVHNYGFAIAGTEQGPDPQTGDPHDYSGLIMYMGSGSTCECMFICGVPGSWNSPPKETFLFADYRSKTQCTYRFIETDGFNEAGIYNKSAIPGDFQGTGGIRVGGGIGNNGSTNPKYEDCYFHDSYVSGGPIFSGAGGPDKNICHGATMARNRAIGNASWGPHPGMSSEGKTFGGLNIEGMDGVVRVERPTIKFNKNQNQYQNPHVSIGNMIANISDMIINEPVWDGPQFGSPAGTWVNATNGAFLVKIPESYPKVGVANAQTSYPTVIKNGITLQWVLRQPGAGWPSGVNPATHGIIVR